MEWHLGLFFLLLLLTGANSTMAQPSEWCHMVLERCLKVVPWTSCYEHGIATCTPQKLRTPSKGAPRIWNVTSAEELEEEIDGSHYVYLPTEVLKRCRTGPNRTTRIAGAMFNSSLFKPTSTQMKSSSEVLGEKVLGLIAGTVPMVNLSEHVMLTFKDVNRTQNGSCVFWQESMDGKTGNWSKRGCKTEKTNEAFICRCNHLSFFAVLINSEPPPSGHIVSLTYITYVGCGLSILFTAIAILMYLHARLFHRKGRDEQSMGVHVQLMGAVLLLHLFFVLGVLWAGQPVGNTDKVCTALGLLIHWALLATFTWMAIESFHLYLLLVRVFNIYVRRYLLKLALVGWGVPTVTVTICAFTRSYGINSFQKDTSTATYTTTEICWTNDDLGKHLTVTGYLGLVFLLGTTMLSVTVTRLWRLRGNHTWNQHKLMWKDCLKLLGLGCVLGVPWGLAFCTYGPLSLPGMYLFTILNSFQGVFMFLWFLSLTCKPHPEQDSVMAYQSTRKTESSSTT